MIPFDLCRTYCLLYFSAIRLQLYLLLRSLALIAETVESGHYVSVACAAVYERQLDEFV